MLGLGNAGARTVRIIQADRLELNKVDDQEIVVISGERVELRVDDDVVVATRVEFNRSSRTLTLIGPGKYSSVDSKGAVQQLSGSDLVVNLGNQAVSGEDVIISDAELEIRGEMVERIPGQLSAQNSYFTPCAKCGRTPDDYAFKAKRLLLYPGDRLIGYQATLLLAGTPVLYLPIVALPLNEASRQPKISYSNDAIDGRTFKADLPFAVSNNIMGTTFLRYYKNREPSFGGGADFTVYAPVEGIDRLNFYGLAEPNPADATGKFSAGYAIDYSFAGKGKFDIENTEAGGLSYSITANHKEIGLVDNDRNKGVTALNAQADVTLINVRNFGKVKVNVTVADQLGPEPTSALSSPLKKPEVTIDPDPYLVTYRNGSTLSADLKVTAGNYQAASNPLSRAASLQGPNYATARLQEEHQIKYLARPWDNADLSITNSFTGRYYLSGQRVIDLNVGLSLSQTFGLRSPTNTSTYNSSYNAYGTALNLPSSAGTFSIKYNYLRREGISPFAFDRIDRKLLSAPIGLALNLTPASGVSVRLSQDYDLILPSKQQQPADLNISVAQEPLQLNLDVKHDVFESQLESVNASGSFGASAARGLNVSFAGSYTRLNGPGTFSTTVKAIGGVRTNTFGVTLVQDLNKRELQSVTVAASAVATRDAVLNPITLSFSEALNLQSDRLDGSLNINWRNYAFSSTHNLTLPKGNLQNGYTSDSLFFSIGNVAGGQNIYNSNRPAQNSSPSSLTWNLKYGGPYDLAKTEWTSPALSAALTATGPAQRISAQASVAFPGSVQQGGPYLQSASLSGNWQFGRRVALSGLASYTRTPPSSPTGKLTETLSLQPLAFNFTFGQAEKPDASLTTTFEQTLTWVGGVRTGPAPLQPVVLLTVDRCCWAFQAEINPIAKRFRIGLVIPGAGNLSAFENTAGVSKFPIFNLNK